MRGQEQIPHAEEMRRAHMLIYWCVSHHAGSHLYKYLTEEMRREPMLNEQRTLPHAEEMRRASS